MHFERRALPVPVPSRSVSASHRSVHCCRDGQVVSELLACTRNPHLRNSPASKGGTAASKAPTPRREWLDGRRRTIMLSIISPTRRVPQMQPLQNAQLQATKFLQSQTGASSCNLIAKWLDSVGASLPSLTPRVRAHLPGHVYNEGQAGDTLLGWVANLSSWRSISVDGPMASSPS